MNASLANPRKGNSFDLCCYQSLLTKRSLPLLPIFERNGPLRFARHLIQWRILKNALNLISRLQSTSGLGVRPDLYSSRKCWKTLSQYSAAKFAVWRGMLRLLQTDCASARSSFAVQYSFPSSSSQFLHK